MRVAVIGPNLRDQSKGQFHVHTEFCLHNITMALFEPAYANPQIFEASSRTEVVDAIYPPDEYERDMGDPIECAAYMRDFYFFQCVKDLK